MTTLNISLTEEQAKLVNKLTIQHGFANRSEFFRAVLRSISAQPKVVSEAAVWPFTAPPTKDGRVIFRKFKKSGLYSAEFLADLAEGLGNSTYFDK